MSHPLAKWLWQIVWVKSGIAKRGREPVRGNARHLAGNTSEFLIRASSAIVVRIRRLGARAQRLRPQIDSDQPFGVNIGIIAPPSAGLNTTLTCCPIRRLSKSQSTMLVSIVTPSSSLT